MNIAVLSDIHGNHIALNRCLEHAISKNIDTFLFLGDYLGDLAYPQKTMQIIFNMISKYNCYFVKGNKEDYWLNYSSKEEADWRKNDSTTGSLLYIYERLTQKDLEFFKTLQPVQDIKIGSMPKITICHGSPNKVNEKLLPKNEKTFEIMENSESSIILCGHTHIQNKIEHKGKTVLNPGAVGVPLHSKGKTQFLILHGNNNQWVEEFVSLDYDIKTTIKELYESGLSDYAPYWCKVTENLLKNGNISHGKVLAKAMELCENTLGNCKWPNIPEKYWEQAVDELLVEMKG